MLGAGRCSSHGGTFTLPAYRLASGGAPDMAISASAVAQGMAGPLA
jgi:hypothetical protein